jgi:hypothetical protein
MTAGANEITEYEARNLAGTLQKATAAGISVLAGPYLANGRNSAVLRFPEPISARSIARPLKGRSGQQTGSPGGLQR